MTDRRRVAVCFGGVSPEHEVSIISGLQALKALDADLWDAVPLYIAKDGRWWSGADLEEPERFKRPLTASPTCFPVELVPGGRGRLLLRRAQKEGTWPWTRRRAAESVEVVLPVLHGGAGENGSLQGLFETLGVPYAGSGPMGAALAMDKVAAKRWAAGFGIPQVPFRDFGEHEWAGSEEAMLDALEQDPGFPCIVKPARLGSSIGITRARDRDALEAAIEDALRYDDLVVVERAVTRLRELNCSVLGTQTEATASVLEEPLSGDELLSFQDKYLSGGSGGGRSGAKGADPPGRPSKQPSAAGMASLDRQIPADLPEAMTREVRDLAARIFRIFGCEGVVRIDFLLDEEDGRVYFNEINTMPGSLSFYLWEPSGVPFPQLLTRILEAGLERHRQKAGRVQTYEVNLLSERDLGGLKGAKG